MKVFCDIDGVLTDFPRAFNEYTGYNIPIEDFAEDKFQVAVGKTLPEIDAKLDFGFWANLPWTKTGRQFLNFLEWTWGHENICLLSFPSYSPEGPSGKVAWVKKELPGYAMRLILATDKRFCAGPDTILFDDRPRNVAEFKAAGGSAVLVPTPWNRMKN
jgi:hypothetical protein